MIEAEEPEYVTLKNMASELDMDRSALRKFVLENGISPSRRRTAESGQQVCLVFCKRDAETIRRLREPYEKVGSKKVVILDGEIGFFYVVQVIPEFDQRRIKMGFSNNADSRLAEHRTSAPTARLLKCWPCRRSWEKTIMDAMSASRCVLILNEVYECEDVAELLARGDQLFSLLPNPNDRVPLSPHSPHNT